MDDLPLRLARKAGNDRVAPVAPGDIAILEQWSTASWYRTQTPPRYPPRQIVLLESFAWVIRVGPYREARAQDLPALLSPISLFRICYAVAMSAESISASVGSALSNEATTSAAL
jgi:hypothetical protein